MKTVYKFTLGVNDVAIMMPVGAEILSAAFQQDTLCIWAKVDTEAERRPRKFKVFGTGQEIPDEFDNKNLKFIDTSFINWFVFHVFEVL